MTEVDNIDEISQLILELRDNGDHFLYAVCLLMGLPLHTGYYPLYVFLIGEIDKYWLLRINDMWKRVDYNFPIIMPETVKFILKSGKKKEFWLRYTRKERWKYLSGEPLYPDWYFQLQAADRLSELGDRAIKPLISALKGSDNSLKTGVLFTLGLMRNSESVQPIIESFSGEIVEVYEDLDIWAYFFSSCSPEIRELREIRNDYSGAVFALQGIDEGDLPLLETALRNPDKKIGYGVALTLRHLLSRYERDVKFKPPKTAVKPRVLYILENALHDPEPFIRYRAISAFTRTKHARLILECLHDEKPEIRKKVLKIILGKRRQFLQDDDYKMIWNTLRDEDDENKQIGLDILLDIDAVNMNSEEVDITYLTDLIEHSNPEIRMRVIRLLGRLQVFTL